jgi:hypothetical protein
MNVYVLGLLFVGILMIVVGWSNLNLSRMACA